MRLTHPGPTRIVKLTVAVLAGTSPSLAVRVTLKIPTFFGVPVIPPSILSFKPSGRGYFGETE